MKILSLNAGSNSLKFEIAEVLPGKSEAGAEFGRPLLRGSYDNVGKENGIFKTSAEGETRHEQDVELPSYGRAAELLVGRRTRRAESEYSNKLEADVFAYNIGQGLATGPTQGFGAAFGKSIKGTPWASGPVDVATGAIVTKFMSVATGSRTLQTLNGAVKLGSVLGEGAEYAIGFGEIKLGYDAVTYFGGLVGCAAGVIR